MYKVLDKDTIEMEIIPYIPKPKRGFAPHSTIGGTHQLYPL